MFFLKQSKYNEFFSFFEYIVTSAETETELLNLFHRPKQDTKKKSLDWDYQEVVFMNQLINEIISEVSFLVILFQSWSRKLAR